ncbi:hypothetical protein [Burkholderia anthina]|uniref:hypothetical protein n=1 Tax=Burkholderia anthina TaxID=179879 RepID=UPI001589FF46|nr:hypothetical protein [Burkholderia anthina]
MGHTEHESALLDALPSYVSISPMLKATPKTEGGRRFIYVEASNESKDQQDEIVLKKALEASADYFTKFGNLDLDHLTLIGARQGIANPESYEIGLPVEVRFDRGATFVKGEIYAGNGLMAEKANLFWSSLTDLNPPKRWYTSVGGAVLAKSMQDDASTGGRVAVVSKVRWSNLAFSATPVNPNLAVASLDPIGPLAKSWGALGFGKSLTADYGTDSASLTGGSALRGQSLDPQIQSTVVGDNDDEAIYKDFRDRLANEVGSGNVPTGSLQELVGEVAARFDLSKTEAAAFVKRFLNDLKRGTLRS